MSFAQKGFDAIIELGPIHKVLDVDGTGNGYH